MNYLLLVYENQHALASISAGERQAQAAVGQFTADLLHASSRLLAGAQLPNATGVTTVTAKEMELILTAGALARAPWHLCAFYYVTANDLNDAIQMAAQMPQLHHGGAIEVHPLSG